MYEALQLTPAQVQQHDAEEIDMYGGSINPIPLDWLALASCVNLFLEIIF